MNLARRFATLLMASTFTSVHAVALSPRGPFGFNFGMTLKEIGVVSPVIKQSAPITYRVDHPPIPNPAFSWYALTVSPLSGLCSVWAVGQNIPTAGLGVEVQEAYAGLKAALIRLYGQPTTTDEQYSAPTFLPADQWPRNWMEQLASYDRSLSVSWSSAQGAKLPQGTALIKLEAAGQKGEGDENYFGQMLLAYERPDVEKCWAERDPVDPSGL